MTNWRFVAYEEHSAAYNMACDVAILDEHLAGNSPPTLRIYSFNPPALSLGANQKLPDEVSQRIKEAGFDVVVRPSGGRAVLHLGDLTYSFVGTAANDKDRLNAKAFLLPSVDGAYRQICSGLIAAFKQLGLELKFANSCAASNNDQDCFAATMTGDLQVNGLKLIGSAQLRRKTAVLQHGTIILRQNPRIIQDLLQPKGKELEVPPPAVRHINLYDVLKNQPSMQQLGDCILHGFQEVFDVTFKTGVLSRYEHERAVTLSQAAKFVHSN